MIVKPYELDKIRNDLKIFLFYGKNEGLKKLYISQCLEKKKNSNVIKYEEKEILENENIFFENILSN
ncbi:hypothetical protein IDG53_06120 [Pelagibacterales bacterium SAG-MED11]|nr:hypothetical protein [Pelagibacterales bacterium SAG-MED11]